MNQQRDEIEIDLRDIFYVLKKKVSDYFADCHGLCRRRRRI